MGTPSTLNGATGEMKRRYGLMSSPAKGGVKSRYYYMGTVVSSL